MSGVEPFYGRWAAVYDLLARAPPAGRWRETAVDALALAPGDTVLDLGCGTGANLPRLRERVGPRGRVVGVDRTPGVLARARERAAPSENVHVVRGDAARPPVASADAVLATFLVGLLDDPAGAVESWLDLVAPGGRVVLLDAASAGRVLDRAFGALVRAGAPGHPAGARERLDRRVAAAHGTLRREGGRAGVSTAGLGYVRVSWATAP